MITMTFYEILYGFQIPKKTIKKSKINNQNNKPKVP